LGAWKKSRRTNKVLYYFAIFVIVNELLIIKNRRISPTYCLMQARDEMRPSSHRDCYMREELFITSGNGYARAARNAGPLF